MSDAPLLESIAGRLTVEEVATRTKQHRITVLRQLAAGEYPNTIQMSQKLLIDPADVEAFIERKTEAWRKAHKIKPAAKPTRRTKKQRTRDHAAAEAELTARGV